MSQCKTQVAQNTDLDLSQFGIVANIKDTQVLGIFADIFDTFDLTGSNFLLKHNYLADMTHYATLFTADKINIICQEYQITNIAQHSTIFLFHVH